MTSVVYATFLQCGHKNNRKFVILVILVAMILSISTQAFNFYQTINKDTLMENVTNETKTSSSPSTISSEDFSLLFGFSNKQEITKDNKEIPVTKLHMVLRGALSGIENERYASAIIQTSNQDKLYEIGDSLPGGATLNQVFSDHIVIKRGNQLEKLYFPETAPDSRVFQEFQPTVEEISKPTEHPPNNHGYPDDMSLEQQMQDLRERLQEASQKL